MNTHVAGQKRQLTEGKSVRGYLQAWLWADHVSLNIFTKSTCNQYITKELLAK